MRGKGTSADRFHGLFDRPRCGAADERAADHHAVGRFGTGFFAGLGSFHHVTVRKPCRGKFVFHFADRVSEFSIIGSLARQCQSTVPRGFGNPQIDGLDERQRNDTGGEMKYRDPLASRSVQRDRCVGHKDVFDDDVLRAGSPHSQHAPGVLRLHAETFDRKCARCHPSLDQSLYLRG